MHLPDNFQTNRLLLSPVSLNDADFILELVNLPDWIKFIGNKNVNSKDAARNYISQMISNPNINYWVVKLKEERKPVGIVTFIKRNYLEHHDIGFAFLPEYRRQGYAYEATLAVMFELKSDPSHTHILATTLKDNTKSVKLLEKLGLKFEKEIQVESEEMLLYAIHTDKLKVLLHI